MPIRGIAAVSRETRLLLLTVAVSLGALAVLAQFRFPAEERIEAPPQPLERLAARATYDELAAIIGRLEQRIAPSLVILRVNYVAAARPRTLQTLLEGNDDGQPATGFMLGLRVRPDMVVARLDATASIAGVLDDDQAVPLLLAADPIRQIALVRVPPPPATVDWSWQIAEALATPRYVVAVEGSRGGATPRPVFLGRAERIQEPRWNTPLLVLARTPVTAEGSLIFSLEGQLIGLTIAESGVLAVVPAAALRDAAIRLLEEGSPRIADFGLALEPLSADAIRAHRVTSGVLVASVAAGSRADGLLQPGDLIQAVDGRAAVNVDAVLLDLAQKTPDRPVRFFVRRDAETVPVDVPAVEPNPSPEPREPGTPNG
jgi:hypothetical protein